jgi:DNA-binding CsgD family transcriptional regulator
LHTGCVISPRWADAGLGMDSYLCRGRGGGAPGASWLTTAELPLIPLVSTHLSFREIGERWYVSRQTVKTQAISVYRKLGGATVAQLPDPRPRHAAGTGGRTVPSC